MMQGDVISSGVSVSKDDDTLHEDTYKSIVSFYDVAEQLIASVEASDVEDPDKQLKIVEPLVSDIETATDTLTEEYVKFVKGESLPTISGKNVENALSRIYSVVLKSDPENQN